MTAWSDYVAGREPQQPSPSGAAQQPSTAWSDYVNETPYMGYGGGRPRTSGTDAFLYNLADGATFGWGDEAVGVIEGAGAAVAGFEQLASGIPAVALQALVESFFLHQAVHHVPGKAALGAVGGALAAGLQRQATGIQVALDTDVPTKG